MELVLVRHALPVRIDATPDGAPADPELRRAAASRPSGWSRRSPSTRSTRCTPHPHVEPGRRRRRSSRRSGVPAEVDDGPGGVRQRATARTSRSRSSRPPATRAGRRWCTATSTASTSTPSPSGRGSSRRSSASPRGTPAAGWCSFSHAGAINAATGAVLGQERTIWFAPDYCSISRGRRRARRPARDRQPQRDRARAGPARAGVVAGA